MKKTEIEIRKIANGWLLTIEFEVDQVVTEEQYFKTFKEVLEYLGKQDIK